VSQQCPIAVVVTVQDLFAVAGLVPRGPVAWGTAIGEGRPGIYVIALTTNPDDRAPDIQLACVPDAERARWLVQQPVLYIGRATRSVRRRLAQFYRHEYGKSAPHRGGQAVIPLECSRWVYWAPTQSPIKAERQMIDAFRAKVGKLPYGNRRR
jgi:hypothetical protein